MMKDFKHDDDFDTYAWDKGRWSYDNGWNYKGEFFGAAYVQNEVIKKEAGELDYLLMLRNGKVPNRTLIIRVLGTQFTEIWSGQIESKTDFDQMMDVVGRSDRF
jgi:hypothetical protein